MFLGVCSDPYLHVAYTASDSANRGERAMLLSDPSITTEIKKIVYHYGSLYPKNRNDIEDIVQGVLCSALRLGYSELSPTYVKTSIHNRLTDLNRLHRASKEHVPLEADRTDNNKQFGEKVEIVPDALSVKPSREVALDVRRAIEESHISGVNVMLLYFIEGMTCKEIAEQTGGTKTGVEGKLSRQIKRAKKLLGDYDNFSNHTNK